MTQQDAWSSLNGELLELVLHSVLGHALPWWERPRSEFCELEFGPFEEHVRSLRQAPEEADDALEMVHDMRCVCRGWRDALSYAAIKVLFIPRPLTRKTCEIFSGVVTLDLEDLRMSEAGGEALRSLRSLRVLRIRELQASTLPSWFAELPLEHLSLGLHSKSERFPENFRAQFLLPPSLAGLHIRSGHRLGLERFAAQLQSLCAQGDFCDSYDWIATSSIRHLQVSEPSLAKLAPALARSRQIESVDLYDEESTIEDTALLSNWLRSGCAKAGLRELRLTGYAFAEGFPSCLRGLQLRKLSFSDYFVDTPQVSTLPDWVADMPLTELDLGGLNQLRTLPRSLGSCCGLRFIDLPHTSISLPFDAVIDIEDFDELELEMIGAGVAVARDVLLPLLAASPQLVVRLVSDMQSSEFVESERAAARGWYRGVPGLLRHGQCGPKGDVEALLAVVAAEVAPVHEAKLLAWDAARAVADL
jgi:hypothetical protein